MTLIGGQDTGLGNVDTAGQVEDDGGGGTVIVPTSIVVPSGGASSVTIPVDPTKGDVVFSAQIVLLESATTFYFLQPNGDGAGSNFVTLLSGADAGSPAVSLTRILHVWLLAGVGDPDADALLLISGATVYIATGRVRRFLSSMSRTDVASMTATFDTDSDSSTPYTSLVLGSNTAEDLSGSPVAGAFGAGSIVTYAQLGYSL